MNIVKNRLVLIIFISLSFLDLSIAQDNELRYAVNRVNPYLSLSKSELNKAQSLSDLNRHYKPSWVDKYLSVEISTIHKGHKKTATNKSNILSSEQKRLLETADAGKDVFVKVNYLPNNTLSHNEPKELDFTFSIDPDNQASFPGGQAALEKFIQEKAIDKLSSNDLNAKDVSIIKFSVNEQGQIINAHIFDSMYNPEANKTTDNILLETIKKMPCWTPAEYADGTKVEQEFILTVGNQESCVINLANTKVD